MSINIRKRNVKEIVFCVIFVILIFQIALQDAHNVIISKIFNYIDDFIALFFVILIFVKILKNCEVTKTDGVILIYTILFLAIGLISSLQLGIQPIFPSIIDFFTCCKFLAGYFVVRLYWKDIDGDFLKKNLNICCRIITVIFFVLVVHDQIFTPFFPFNGYRLWGKSMQLFYPHSTYLAASSIAIFIVLIDSNKNKSNLIYLFMISFVIFTTFRAKAIAFVGLFWFLYLFIVKFKIKNIYIYAFFGSIVILILGYSQIKEYFIDNTWMPRPTMMRDAIKFAVQYFPLGLGFATFGTNMAAKYYSPIYNILEYYKNPVMAPETANCLCDGFWQALIGQFGIIGTICFIIIIICFFKIIFSKKITKNNMFSYLSILCIQAYMLISSMGEMAYFAPFAILFFMLYAIILNEMEEKKE